MNKKEIKKILLENSAYLSIKEGELLFELAQGCQGDIVEIGSFLGGSTVILAKGLKNPHKVYAIDPHIWIDALIRKGKKLVTLPRKASQVLKNNIKKWGMEEKIVLIGETSEKAAKNWRGKIGFLWIDGDHEYNSAKKDFLLWEPFLKKGGAIAFHDSVYNDEVAKKIIPFTNVHPRFFERPLFFEGPQKVVKEYLYNSKRFKEKKSIDTITYAVKTENANFIERLKNKKAVYKINPVRNEVSNGVNNPEGPIFFIKIKCYVKNLFKKLFFSSTNFIKLSFLKIDRWIGLFGIFLKKTSPRIYYFIKKIKSNCLKL